MLISAGFELIDEILHYLAPEMSVCFLGWRSEADHLIAAKSCRSIGSCVSGRNGSANVATVRVICNASMECVGW